jgi:hypothetical protein
LPRSLRRPVRLHQSKVGMGLPVFSLNAAILLDHSGLAPSVCVYNWLTQIEFIDSAMSMRRIFHFVGSS